MSCKKCGKYTINVNICCKPCQIENLKENFTNWTSGNEKIDDFIQEMQLKIDHPWYLYNQFSDVKEIGRGGFATVYSAIWKDGRLYYNSSSKEYTRDPNYKVALKCLHKSQNITNEFLNEV